MPMLQFAQCTSKESESDMKTQKTIAEILRAATATKPQRVPVANVVIDPKMNVREPDVTTWDVPGIAADMALDGQKEPALLHKVGDKYFPARGFRRCSGVKYNAENGIIDPTTNKVFETVLAFVINDELTERERWALVLDGGNTRGLNKAELFYAVEQADRIWDTDAQISVAMKGLLDQHYPMPTKKLEEMGKLSPVDADRFYADYRRGAIGNLLNAARSPVVVRDACVEKIKQNQNWPNDAEVRTLLKKYRELLDADKSKKINRVSPGTEFMQVWAEFVAKKKADVDAGRKPKSTAAMSGEDMGKVAEKCDSRFVKVTIAILRREISQEHLPTVDGLGVDMESGKATPEQIESVLDSITGPTPVAEVTV